MAEWRMLEEVEIPKENKTLIMHRQKEVGVGGRGEVYTVVFSVEKDTYTMAEDREERWGDNARERSYEEFNKRLDELGIDQRVEP